MPTPRPAAIVFDTFGTVVDWRSSLIADLTAFGQSRKVTADWAGLVDAWRAAYQPSMSRVRSGEVAWAPLDDLHRELLDQLVAQFGITGLSKDDLDHINRGWHRLEPVAGFGARPDPAEGALHHRAAVERQRRAARQHGQARRLALGHGVRRGCVRPLQAGPGDLSRRRAAARSGARPR